jgi:nitrite reductase/ring-hydroxylating ferredoxin subunit
VALVRVARLDDLPAGQGYAVEVDGEEIALFKVGDRVYATSNICSHAFAFLSEGTLEGPVVTCPRHGGQFDVRTGQALRLPAVSPIATYPVALKDGEVWVEVGT